MKKILLFSFLFLIIPVIILYSFIFESNEEIFKFSRNTMIRVYITKEDKVINVPLEKYVEGVVSGEMPVSFNEEALKAQAVAARSYIMYKIVNDKKKNKNYDVVDTVMNQVYLDDNSLKKKWGKNYVKNKSKVENAVYDTSYEYITYNGKIAYALFFSTSGGYTENSEEVFSSKVHYLQSVKSEWDKISPVFSEKNIYTYNDFCKKLQIECKIPMKIEIIDKTSAGRINKIFINGNMFTGSEVVKKLGIRSSNFTIDIMDKVYVTTHGYGHGVGMSQYGAEGMARAGYKYDDILKYYYKDVEIKKIK